MKKPDQSAALSQGRKRRWRPIRSMSIRSRIFLYFLMFTALLLVFLWLFQIVFLDEFYRLQLTDSLRASSDSIARNIDNPDLEQLTDRIAERDGVCVLVFSAQMEPRISAEATPGCVIHHISLRDLWRMAEALGDSTDVHITTFTMIGFRNDVYDAGKFAGRVPPSDDGTGHSMVTAQRAIGADGSVSYVFLNAQVTPVTSTVSTIRIELYFITVLLVLLSFLLSLVLSRRITRPLVEVTAAAASLSQSRYSPVEKTEYREIAQLNDQLIRTARDLRRVEEMQRELIANISHDLRTPLTLIEGYAEAMRDLPGENTPENMQVIIDETRRLSTLVSAVMDLSAARNGGELQIARLNLTALIRGILTRYAKLTEQDGYRIVFEPPCDVFVRADEVKVQQVVYNLINNALTYTGEDRTVTVRQLLDGQKVRIEVCDSGEGIAPEDLPYIWDRYYRGSKPHKRAAIGSGLGLNIVKGILESHGLRYGVESALGQGSTFWFEIAQDAKEEV